MDYMILNSLLTYHDVPPLDLWYSGKTLSVYYYYGYWIFSNIIQISRIPLDVSFNFILPTVAGIASMNIYAISRIVTQKRAYLPLLTLLIPNLGFIYLVILRPDVSVLPSSIRVILGTANEYPLFAFINGDVHPYCLAIWNILFFLFLLALSWSVWAKSSFTKRGLLSGATALSLGSVIPINTWDIVILGPMCIVFGVFLGIFISKDSFTSLWVWCRRWMTVELQMRDIFRLYHVEPVSTWVVWILLIPSFSFILFLPYYFAGEFRSMGLAIVPEPSILFHYFLVNGLFFILSAIIYAKLIAQRWYLLCIPIPFLIIGYGAVGICFLFIVCAIINRKNIVDFFQGFGYLSILLPEIFFFREFQPESLYRLNTVFKLFWIGWIILGVSCFIGIWLTIEEWIRKKQISYNKMVMGELIVLFIVLMGSLCISFDYYQGAEIQGLNGFSFLHTISPGDYDAIKYLRTIDGFHTIVESTTYLNSWTYMGRISTFSGIPCIVGWVPHEIQWREDPQDVFSRVIAGRLIYEEPSGALYLMDQLHADLLYVGKLEKAMYEVSLPAIGLEKIYDQNDIQIFKRTDVPSSPPGALNVSIEIPDYSTMMNVIIPASIETGFSIGTAEDSVVNMQGEL